MTNAHRRSTRTLDERIALRVPGSAALVARAGLMLPPRSRLRRAFVWRTARIGLDAYNRRDIDAIAINFHRDFEYRTDPVWVKAGLLEPCYRGLAEYRRYVATVDEVWGGENYLTLTDVMEDGEQMLVLARGSMRAQASGVPLTETFALLLTMKGGRAVCIQEFYDNDEALAALRGAQPS